MVWEARKELREYERFSGYFASTRLSVELRKKRRKGITKKNKIYIMTYFSLCMSQLYSYKQTDIRQIQKHSNQSRPEAGLSEIWI